MWFHGPRAMLIVDCLGKAWWFFREMGLNGVKPNSVTVSNILPACAELKTLDSGRAMHGFAVRHGMVENVFICSALTSMYASHSRMVDEGLLIFNSMGRDHSVEPDTSHCSSMVDVFSRAGRLDEAYEFIQRLPMEPTARAWVRFLVVHALEGDISVTNLNEGISPGYNTVFSAYEISDYETSQYKDM
ncbi:unnamed protein product [Lupinus luteus]|uniref:Pentatricopeptide repeat-containing protein n=1 Tax=Lupinus luteus TaxID=3873 RepID=A0AAV1XXZ9_LUPLU